MHNALIYITNDRTNDHMSLCFSYVLRERSVTLHPRSYRALLQCFQGSDAFCVAMFPSAVRVEIHYPNSAVTAGLMGRTLLFCA